MIQSFKSSTRLSMFVMLSDTGKYICYRVVQSLKSLQLVMSIFQEYDISEYGYYGTTACWQDEVTVGKCDLVSCMGPHEATRAAFVKQADAEVCILRRVMGTFYFKRLWTGVHTRSPVLHSKKNIKHRPGIIKRPSSAVVMNRPVRNSRHDIHS